MRNKHFTLMAVLAVSVTAWAQTSLRGQVIDETTQQPVVGARITLANQNISTTTNAAGEFIAYGVIGVVGLGIKWLMLWCFNTLLGWHYMLVWLVATIIVLIWNYAARKVLLYRKKK